LTDVQLPEGADAGGLVFALVRLGPSVECLAVRKPCGSRQTGADWGLERTNFHLEGTHAASKVYVRRTTLLPTPVCSQDTCFTVAPHCTHLAGPLNLSLNNPCTCVRVFLIGLTRASSSCMNLSGIVQEQTLEDFIVFAVPSCVRILLMPARLFCRQRPGFFHLFGPSYTIHCFQQAAERLHLRQVSELCIASRDYSCLARSIALPSLFFPL
jgi:hypothetical protein